MIFKLFALLGVLFSTPFCFGIGRTGNGGIADFDDGFSAQVPFNYRPAFDRAIADDGLMIVNPIGLGLAPTWIQFRQFSSEFSQLKASTRSQISDFFTSKAWTPLHFSNPCIDVFEVTNSTATNVIAVWGSNKGVVILATSPNLETQVIEITKSIELESGACQWK